MPPRREAAAGRNSGSTLSLGKDVSASRYLSVRLRTGGHLVKRAPVQTHGALRTKSVEERPDRGHTYLKRRQARKRLPLVENSESGNASRKRRPPTQRVNRLETCTAPFSGRRRGRALELGKILRQLAALYGIPLRNWAVAALAAGPNIARHDDGENGRFELRHVADRRVLILVTV